MKRMYKSKTNKTLCGVCGGIAEYFNIDPTIVRLAAAGLGLISLGTAVLVYIAAALIIPDAV